MWTVIYVSSSERIAERIRQHLTEEGFLIQVKQLSGSKNQFEILVPASELDEVQEVLQNVLQNVLQSGH